MLKTFAQKPLKIYKVAHAPFAKKSCRPSTIACTPAITADSEEATSVRNHTWAFVSNKTRKAQPLFPLCHLLV